MKISHRSVVWLSLAMATATVAACSGGEQPAPAPGPVGTGTSTGTSPSPTGTNTVKPSPTGTGTSASKKKFGQQCAKSADCESDFCVFLSGGSSLGMCTKTCEDDIDCPGLDNKCVALSDAPQKVCVPK